MDIAPLTTLSTPCFVGTPPELRVHIYEEILGYSHLPITLKCSTQHAHTADGSQQSRVIWDRAELIQLQGCMKSLGQLLGINKLVKAEIQGLCFRKWEIQFCIKYSGDKYCSDVDMHSLLGPWLTENYSKDKEFFWRPPLNLRGWLRVLPRVVLKVFYSSIENREDMLWEHKVDRWDAIDHTRSLVLALNEIGHPKELEVEMSFHEYDKRKRDEQDELARYLRVFEHLSEAVSLKISFDMEKPLRNFPKYLDRLQSADRRTHFPVRKYLFPTWYRLRCWAEYAFAFCVRDDEWEDGWRDMWFAMNDKKDDSEIQDLLEDGWDAHNEGDETTLLKVKEDLGVIWKRQQQDCKKEWDNIWDDDDP